MTNVESPYAISYNCVVFPDVPLSHVAPLSEEVRTVPFSPTATKVLFPNAIPSRSKYVLVGLLLL